jgi:hypothetical protein
VRSISDVARSTLFFYRLWNPVSSVLLAGLLAGVVVGLTRRDRALRGRHLFALVACGAAFLGVLSQLKFYAYHFGMVVGPAVLAAANVAVDVAALVRARMPSRGPALAPIAYSAVLLAVFALTGSSASQWLEEVTVTEYLVSGFYNAERFARSFHVDVLHYSFHDVEQVALWLRKNTSPSDEVAVRGFEPGIYVTARRRYGGRFFWTAFLTEPTRAYRRPEWLADDLSQLAQRKPRWVVALAEVHAGPDSPEYFVPMGYVQRKRLFGYVIMERVAGTQP